MVVKAIKSEHTIAIVDPGTWKTHTISIHPSLVDEFLKLKLKLDKKEKQKQKVKIPTGILDSAEEHLLTLCRPKSWV